MSQFSDIVHFLPNDISLSAPYNRTVKVISICTQKKRMKHTLIRLLAIDMDETCLNDKKYISKENLAAMKQAADAGIMIVPTTGRALSCLPHQLKEQPFYRYVISSNGAVVTDTHTGKDLFQAAIPHQQAMEFLSRCDAIDTGISAHIHHEFVIQGHGLRLLGKLNYGKDALASKYAKNIADLLLQEPADVEEIQLFYFSKETEARTKQLLSRYDCFLQSGSSHYTELYSKQASKGNALDALAKHLELSPADIACIGDADNDLSMFRASGLKFAMGNAIPALKELADFVVPSNNDSGVAYAIKHHLL